MSLRRIRYRKRNPTGLRLSILFNEISTQTLHQLHHQPFLAFLYLCKVVFAQPFDGGVPLFVAQAGLSFELIEINW